MVERAWRDGLVADGRSGYVGVGLTAEADLAVEREGACAGVHHGKHRSWEPVHT